MHILQHSAVPQQISLHRVLTALVVSLCVHLLVISCWDGHSGASGLRLPAPPALHAQLDPAPHPAAEPDPPQAPVVHPAEKPVTRTRTATAAAKAPPITDPEHGVSDARFYLARELDQYPAPLSALMPGSDAAGSVRLWVSIDHAGRVLDAALVDPTGGNFSQSLRERMLATRFEPARRDGRPVKSRVLMVVGRDL